MKTPPLGFFCVLLVGSLGAQEVRPVSVAPQPRVKLEPVARAAATSSAPAEITDAVAPAPVMLERFVVKGALGVALRERRKDPLREEKFSLLRGGNFVERDLGNLRVIRNQRVTVSFKPWFDLFEDDARFKHRPAPRQNITLLQIR